MSIVEAVGLGRTFRARGVETVAVDDVSFTIKEGASLGLVGESGSGKSTIARMLVGLEHPDEGTLHIAGIDCTVAARGMRERKRRASVAQMVFQDPNGSLDRRLTVTEALTRAIRVHRDVSAKDARTSASTLLDRVGLSGRHAGAKPHELSGGQRQRVAIARALAVEPRLVVLDEAVSALDVSVQAQVLELLDEIRRDSNISYLFVSHDLAVVQEVTDEVLVLFRGRTMEQGTTREVLESPQSLYTQLLIASTPGTDWNPQHVVELRKAFERQTAGVPVPAPGARLTKKR